MDQYIGKMLDNRYEILERIGTGGMAVVYKAKCHRLNRLVAIKILKSDLAQDADFRRRFNAESQAVAQLSHPNIVSVYDVSKGGDVEYIVMELIDGITLKQYMEKRGQLNWRESLHFITQIMRGLSHAHSRGIVHRDIKPQNIMVLRDGSVKVADFGIACLENSAQTLTQEALGSVHYISPEQARGDRTDARSDIYSAGVVLYEMLAGRLPFEGDSAVSVAIQHLSSIPLPPREINPDIPEQLELICMKAMAPDLERRYFSAEEMIADLEAFRKNPDVELEFQKEDLRPTEEDEPTQLLHTAAVTGGTTSRTSRASRPAVERRREYEDDEPEQRGGGRTRAVLIGIVCVLAVALVAVLFKTIFSSFGTPVPEQYTVPNILGYTLEAANQHADIKDIFTIEVNEETITDSEYDPGEIAKQSPKAGEVRKGEQLVIEVWLSAEAESDTMPDVTGKSVAEARSITLKDLIEKYELMLEAKEEDKKYDDEVPEGSIISSIPAAGETLAKGQTIRLIVSKGPQPIAYIPFKGLTLQQALEQLKRLGLEDGTINYQASQEPAETVIGQDPDPETVTEVAPGTKVNLVVSSGPNSMAGSDILMIPLPTDRETGILKVYQDGEVIVNKEEVDCTPGTYSKEIFGSGEVHIIAYLDDELIFDQWITIDPYNG
ncbi:Stk1 family PASTA domain-containing Ser/Thr kinase [uncultured Dysosmobacter sp.]|uniref:Stk1 family PASTA domain-containing Ser/Thr kinase n=1 Tax=uncultured Dysosmobacter sp. TaxID=2591384 RepID=UPI002639C14C|nr:Stk1 family PASTA domain-containing Ser/Thr kinase [uncultured Dysosmobacter sp.]